VAAEGLAKVKVREADAIAIEKEGGAKARVTKTQMEAEAQGKMAEADAVERRGLAEAAVERERRLAVARKGSEEQGLAQARVREAEAAAVQKLGEAEAVAVEKKLTAEAKGLHEKAEAMKALDGVGREHEEFRLRLEKEKQVELAALEAQQKIADARAAILKEAFAAAKINIVGGDGQFFDRFVNAVSVGKSVDGFVDQSDRVQQLFGKYLGGGGNLPGEVLDAIGSLSTKDLQNLSLSGVLGNLMVNADEPMKDKLQTLLEKARELGVDALPTPKGN
jgi:hypothetical protein